MFEVVVLFEVGSCLEVAVEVEVGYLCEVVAIFEVVAVLEVGVVGLCEVLFEVVALFEVGGVPCLVFPPAPLLAHNLWAAPPPCPEIF